MLLLNAHSVEKNSRRNRWAIAVGLGCSLLVSSSIKSQDLHFSQWFNAPLMTNPANTGFIPDADYRLGANYRKQWTAVSISPYNTFSIWGDAQLFRDKIGSGWVGLGGLLLRDVAGTGSLTSTKAYASLAYHQMIGVAHLLSFGMNAGWANKWINTAKLTFPDQYDAVQFIFDGNLPTAALGNYFTPSINYVDIQAGLNYAFFPSPKIYVNGGLSAWHLNQPRESFFSDASGNDNQRIPPRYSAFANGSFKVAPNVILNTMAYWSSQTRAYEIVAGGSLQYNLSKYGDKQVIFGAFTRWGESLIPMVGFEMQNIRLSFTYDANLSSLNFNNPFRGAYEFALLHSGFYPSSAVRQTLCPSFRR
ncbi:MAG: PorP/SprF family type IX secretion system membrane protein [Chitinophagaceae bacterium]